MRLHLLLRIVVLALAGTGALAARGPQPKVQKFEVVSIKPCDANTPTQGRSGTPAPTSPDRWNWACPTLSTMIQSAYLTFADGRWHSGWTVTSVTIEGGPAWIRTQRYAIEAKAEQPTPAPVMRGPMLKAALEDRFKLKLHRETREVPVYEWVPAKSGLKVVPFTGTDCVLRTYDTFPAPVLPAGQRYCGDDTTFSGDRIIRTGVMTLDEMTSLVGSDRPIVNRTGMTGAVRYRLEFQREIVMAGDGPSASFLAAFRDQLGIEWKAAKGPREFLVIDSAERPSPNAPLLQRR